MSVQSTPWAKAPPALMHCVMGWSPASMSTLRTGARKQGAGRNGLDDRVWHEGQLLLILNHQPPRRNVLGHPPGVRPTPRGASPPAPSFPSTPVCSLVLAGGLGALGHGVEGGLAPSGQVGG